MVNYNEAKIFILYDASFNITDYYIGYYTNKLQQKINYFKKQYITGKLPFSDKLYDCNEKTYLIIDLYKGDNKKFLSFALAGWRDKINRVGIEKFVENFNVNNM